MPDRQLILPNMLMDEVNHYAESELADYGKYDNRQPFDESGLYSLVLLAARIYAAGHADGFQQSRSFDHGVRRAERARPASTEGTEPDGDL